MSSLQVFNLNHAENMQYVVTNLPLITVLDTTTDHCFIVGKIKCQLG